MVSESTGPVVGFLPKVSGEDFASSMTVGKSHLELLFIGGEQYMRSNEQFWIDALDARQGTALAKVIGDRWVTGNKQDKSFEEMFRIGSAEQFLKPNGTLSKDTEKEIDGVAAIGLKDADDAVLYVATTGEPYPLRLAGKGGVALEFSEFGMPSSDFKMPTEDEVVNLDALQGRQARPARTGRGLIGRRQGWTGQESFLLPS